MAKEKAAQGQYGDVVHRLQEIVSELEAGELSLEDSINRFQEGMTLVKRGEGILSESEKRIEQLLSEDGRTAPLQLTPPGAPASEAKTAPAQAKRPAAPAPGADDDDVPF